MILLQHSINAPLGYIGANGGEFNLSNWYPCPQNVAFHFFGTNPDVSGTSVCICGTSDSCQYVWFIGFTAVEEHKGGTNNPWQQPFVRFFPVFLKYRMEWWFERWPYTLLPCSSTACTSICSNWLWRPVITCDDVHTNWISLSLCSSNNLGKPSFKEPAAGTQCRQYRLHLGRWTPLVSYRYTMSRHCIFYSWVDQSRLENCFLINSVQHLYHRMLVIIELINQGSDNPLRHQFGLDFKFLWIQILIMLQHSASTLSLVLHAHRGLWDQDFILWFT